MARRSLFSWLENRRVQRQVAAAQAQRRAQVDAARADAFRDVETVAMSVAAEVRIDGELIGISTSYDGRLIVASSNSTAGETFASRDEVSATAASFPHSQAKNAYVIDLAIVEQGGQRETIRISDVPISHPQIQLMPDGRVLLVGSRSYFREGKGEHNALLVTPGDQAKESFCIGDGVSSVQVDKSGRIWAGYFDEGVFGNFGWGLPDSEPPLGRAGLVCWSTAGDQLYEFAPPADLGPIDDCYALNVFDDQAWVCYYSDFPVVSIDRNFAARGWLSEVAGAHSIAVGSKGRIGLVGGYGGLFDRLVLLATNEEVMNIGPTFRLVLPDGGPLPDDARILARGGSVSALANGQWLQLNIEEFAGVTV